MLGEEFLSLSLDQVCSLISSDKLTVSSEEKVLWSPLGKHEPYRNKQTNKRPFKLKKKKKGGLLYSESFKEMTGMAKLLLMAECSDSRGLH